MLHRLPAYFVRFFSGVRIDWLKNDTAQSAIPSFPLDATTETTNSFHSQNVLPTADYDSRDDAIVVEALTETVSSTVWTLGKRKGRGRQSIKREKIVIDETFPQTFTQRPLRKQIDSRRWRRPSRHRPSV